MVSRHGPIAPLLFSDPAESGAKSRVPVSQNPSNLVFNNWGSGNMGFMGAALPTTDVTMRIKSLQVWYETNDDSSMPAGCAEANVCAV